MVFQPLVVDGGELTVLRSLASGVWGQWRVSWPDSVPEEQRPRVPEGRVLGFVSGLGGVEGVGVLGRRFVKGDVEVVAADPDVVGVGRSNVEMVLDDALRRTSGQALVEREITRAGLGGLVPGVDFGVGDVVPVLVWGFRILLPVVEVEQVSVPGGVVDWRVHVGGSLLEDVSARERMTLELERQIAQERRKRAGDVRVVSREVARVDSRVDVVAREVRGELASLAAGLAEDISSLVGEDVFGEYRADLHARLWGAQGELNKISARFMAQQEEINRVQRQAIAANSAAIKANEDVLGAQRRALEALGAAQAAQTRINRLVARPLGASVGESDEDDYGRLTVWVNNAEFYAKGNWVGKVYLSVSFEALNNYNKLFVVNVTSGNRTISMAPFLFQGVRDVLLLYKVDSGGL